MLIKHFIVIKTCVPTAIMINCAPSQTRSWINKIWIKIKNSKKKIIKTCTLPTILQLLFFCISSLHSLILLLTFTIYATFQT